MEHKNSLEKVNQKHIYYGNLKEENLLNYNDKIDDLSIISNNTNKYLDKIKNENYNYTLDELCNLLEITKAYANTYFIDKLDTLYVTRSCKLYIYALKSKDTKQIKYFAQLFKDEDKKEKKKKLTFIDNTNFKDKLKTLNLTKERLLKKYFIKEDSIKSSIKEIFKKEVRNNDNEIIDYIDLDNSLIDVILDKGLISNNTLKAELGVSTDTQLYRILYQFDKLLEIRIAVVNENNNKYNTVRYINNKDIINKVKFILDQEKKQNEEFAKERYKAEKRIF